MQASKVHIAIAVCAGGLLLVIFLGYLNWLGKQGPVLARSEERDHSDQHAHQHHHEPVARSDDRAHGNRIYDADERRQLPPGCS